MFVTDGGAAVYLACGSTDLRKAIDGLAAIVRYTFDLDPFDQSLFVFCNKQRDKIKILVWEHNGFWLYYRRLEKGRFRWPASQTHETIQVSRRGLSFLLCGLELQERRAHKPVFARIAA